VGSVADLARSLSETLGVIEPFQSKYSIEELVEELREQLLQHCICPVTLIGHSWGAWLAGLFASRYPDYVKKIILVGCGPLTSDYIAQIGERRKVNLTREEAQEFETLMEELNHQETVDKDKKLNRLGQLAEAADYFSKVDLSYEPSDTHPSDGDMYSSIWPEAATMRESGELLEKFSKISCSITVIHGRLDPHPYEGVITPITECGLVLRSHLLDRCGHTPWKEQYAASEFNKILLAEIMEMT
jgi:pimeloyl-ACP methyl ester carboxylesterase